MKKILAVMLAFMLTGTLILFSVLSSLNRVSAVLVDDVCVMSRSNVFCLVDVCPVDHALPLNVEVAANAGIGRFAVQVT